MAIDLEKLNIVIEGNSTDASASVDVLIDYLKELKKAADDLKGVANSTNTFFKNVSKSSKNATSSITATSDALEGTAEASSRVSKTSGGVDKLVKEYKDLGEEVRKTSENFGAADTKLGRFMSSVKRIAVYRLIRTAIREVAQAVSEGLEILVEWDRVYGENTSRAAQTTDELAAKWYEVKKSIGAAIMPIIQVVQPALEWIMNIVIGIAEVINQIVRAAQGYSDYMKATYNYTKAATSTAKELKRVLFGFDELNVLPSNAGSGTTINASALDYVPTEIDDTWLEIGQSLKKIWGDLNSNFAGTMDGITRMFEGAGKIMRGALNGDWKLSFEGLGELAIGFAQTTGSAIKGVLYTVGDVLFPEFTQKVKDFAEEASKAFEDGLITKEELWGLIGGLLGYSGEQAESKFNAWLTKFNRWIAGLAVKVGQWIIDSPALSFLYELFGGDLNELKVWVKFMTDTYLSPDTQRLIALLSDIKAAQGAFNGNTSPSGLSYNNNGLENLFKLTTGLQGFAGGGDPVKGSLFYAGEAGAEVVANGSGGTGVMNMQQMQAAVSNGNMEVVSAIGVMANLIVNAINNKSSDLYIGEDAIGRAATRYMNGQSRATGVPVLAR